MKHLYLLMILFFFSSCQDTKPDIESCNRLARHTYKGLPKAAAKFKKYCQNKNLSWSPERCQEVFTKVILSTPKKTLTSEYGPEFMECFSTNDILKFGAYLAE